MKIMLIGNYVPDGQESMLRYADLLSVGLREAGHEVLLTMPQQHLRQSGATGLRKWIGYIDKFLLGPTQLARAARGVEVVHVCDHSNAVYIPRYSRIPYTVTCHDLLAVRGALGEDTDCPATLTGRMLQSAILRGLGRAEAVACVSRYTLRDFQRLLPAFRGRIDVVPNALNYPYRELETSRQATKTPYVLHVGSSHRRKNRETAIRAMAAIAARWEGNLVFAGQALSAEQRRLAASLGAADRIVEVINPDNPALERLYNGALALIFPSRFEGFGWPVIEAQACGCAVICSDREPFPEVSGGAAVFCDADDAAAFGDAILSLANSSALRRDLSDRGLSNAAHHSLSAMTAGIEALLEHALASR